MPTRYICDTEHYNEVIARCASVKSSLWIGTADIKDLHVKVSSDSLPFLAVLAKLVRKGVCVRLLHAKEPGPVFREEFDRYPSLFTGLERALSRNSCHAFAVLSYTFDGHHSNINTMSREF